MKVSSFPSFVLALLLLGVVSSVSYGQQFDYEKYPTLNFSFNELDLDLTIDPDSRSIQGKAGYEVEANIQGADSLVLQAARMEISAVMVNEGSAEYYLHNDSLVIELPDSSEIGEAYTVSVEYETIPNFGVLTDDRGTMWSSMLPRSHRHWFPGIDHPRVRFNSTMHLTVPSGYQAVANGVKLEEEILDVDNVRYTFKTRSKVPATSLAFAVGQFDHDETSFGIKKINLNIEIGLLEESERDDLLDKASNIVDEAENALNREFPFERLNIVVLQDHFWETKTWGASTVFLYKNNGNLAAQLKRGIYAQWFGVLQREEQWSDADAINLLQAALHFNLEETPAIISNGDDFPEGDISSIYDSFGAETWNNFQHNFKGLSKRFRQTVTQSLDALMEKGEGVYDFREYGEFWYKQNGQPVFSLDFMAGDTQKQTSSQTDSVRYRVDYRQNDSGLRLVFTAEQGMYDELVTLPLVQISSGSVDTLEVTFTGAKDSVSIQVPALTENVKILSSSMPELQLDEYKPASYLIYQLRNAETVEERVRAAEKMGYHSDNPDLQFAIRDFMDQETDPQVKAALLKSFGDITAGASGTEKVFLDALKSDNIRMQEAGLYVLQNYSGNEQVQETVRQFAQQADSLPAFKKAARVLSSMADSTVFEEFVSNTVRTDTAGHKAIFAIQVLANTGDTPKANRQAEFYLSDVYEYSIRSTALGILLQHDSDPDAWEARAEDLLGDSDPRIRFLTVLGLSKIDGLAYVDMMENRRQDEYDERVYKAMKLVMSNE